MNISFVLIFRLTQYKYKNSPAFSTYTSIRPSVRRGGLSVRGKAKNLRDGFYTLNTFSFVLIQKKQKIKARDCFLVQRTFTSYNFASNEPFHPLLSRCFVGDFSTTSKKNAAQFGVETETSKCQELDIFGACLR